MQIFFNCQNLNILYLYNKQQLGVHKKFRSMFKRCHSLKRSNINIKNFSKPKSNMRYAAHNIEGQKQNTSYNINIKNYEPQLSMRTYTYQNAQLTKSIELSYIQTLSSSQKPFNSIIPTKDLNSKNSSNPISKKQQQKNIQTIKKLCKDIEQVNNKITMYKQILRKNQVKHNKQKITKIQQKQKILAMLIDLYQKQRDTNDNYKSQLVEMGVKDFDKDSLLYSYAYGNNSKNVQAKQRSNQELRSNRRTTATFNYF